MRSHLFASIAGVSALSLATYAILQGVGVRGPGALALIAASALAYALAALLSRPIHRAASFVTMLTRGEAPTRLPEARGGRVGDLYRALNRVAEALRFRLHELGTEQSETEALLEEMGDGVLALSPEGVVVRANAKLLSLVGAAAGLQGRTLHTVFRNPELVRFLAPAKLGAGGAQGEFEVFGRAMLVSARSLPAGGIVAVFSDVSELRRLDTVRTEFVANASHELKTPLTAVKGYAETLLEAGLSAEDRDGFARRIVEHADRMTAIVEDLITLARLEEPGRAIASEPVQLSPLIETVREVMSTRAAANTEIVVEIDPPDLRARGDREGIRQILENLVDNAIRHSAARKIVLRASHLGASGIRISVVDDGRGIPSQHLDRIFERFYRVDPARSRDTGGTGLGLAIVKHWVEAMGGRVKAESTVGQGTQIHVELHSA